MAVYYVSPNGDDSRAGNSKELAWKTCAKVNASAFLPGDRIRFERGGKWNETLIPSSSGVAGNEIVYEAYGIGQKPIVTGEIEITDWVPEGNNIWSKTYAYFNNIQLLTIAGATREKGRFPKNSYLTTASASGNTWLSSNDAAWLAAGNFTNGELVVTKNSWIQDRGTITNHSGNGLTYTGTSAYPASPKWGFFVQNHANCLTDFGDWRFDNSAKKLYMHFGNSNPNDHVVKVANRMNVVDLVGKNYCRFEYMEFLYGHREIISLTNAKTNTFKKCNIQYGGNRGAQHYDGGGFSDGTTFDECRISDTFNNAIKANNNMTITVKNCDIKRNYIHAGTTDNGDGHGATLAFGVDNYRGGFYTVEDNVIQDSGYDAIQYAMSNVSIRRNKIYRYCLTREDGGAIYCFGPKNGAGYVNRFVTDNIIVDGLPLNVPNGHNAQEVYAIYLDEHSTDVTVDNNTVINAVNGIYLHTALNNFIKRNKIYLTTHSGIFLKSNSVDAQSSGNLVTENEVRPLSGRMIKLVSPVGLYNFGTFSKNKYFRHAGGESYEINYGATNYTSLSSFVSALGYDADSTISNMSVEPVPEYPVNDPVSLDPDLGEDLPPDVEPEPNPDPDPEPEPEPEPEIPIPIPDMSSLVFRVHYSFV